ncbi:unnamed protein product, partial [Meganyctiphanes norvegica]
VPIIPDYLYNLEHPTVIRGQRSLTNSSLSYSRSTLTPPFLAYLTEVNDDPTSAVTNLDTTVPTTSSLQNSWLDRRNGQDIGTSEHIILDTIPNFQKKDLIENHEKITNENKYKMSLQISDRRTTYAGTTSSSIIQGVGKTHLFNALSKSRMRKNSSLPTSEQSVSNISSATDDRDLHASSQQIPEDIISENGRVGLLFSSKAFVQLVVNPFIGPLTAKIGYPLPLLVGTHTLIISALLFAYAESYNLLFVARSIQGIASSCIAISGLGLVAECYPEDRERGRMQGFVMGGIATGVLLGYPAGGMLYDFTESKTSVFLTVAILTSLLV